MFTKESKSGLAKLFATDLREQILKGILPGGHQLKQDHLAKVFNSSHVPIREALQMLVAEGLAEHIPRCGVVVRDLRLADVHEVIEMRVELESLALRLSCPHLSVEQLEQAEKYLSLDKTEEDIDLLIEYNWQFHRLLYSGVERPKLMATIEELWVQAERYMRFVWVNSVYNPKSHDEHLKLLKACKSGSYEIAEKILKKHIVDAGKNAEKLLGKPVIS